MFTHIHTFLKNCYYFFTLLQIVSELGFFWLRQFHLMFVRFYWTETKKRSVQLTDTSTDKRKVTEDAGSRPLLPVHKHDLWMILHWESWGSLWLQVCSCTVSQRHCKLGKQAACAHTRVTESFCGFDSGLRLVSLWDVFALETAQGTCMVRDRALPLVFC